MALLLLVRHGQASWGAADYDVLSETGWEQARLLGQSLKERGLRPEVAICGTMRRHHETWAGILQGMGSNGSGESDSVPMLEDAGWNEFDHHEVLGELPVFPPGTPRHVFRDWFEGAMNRWTNAEASYREPFVDFTRRVEEAMNRACQQMLPRPDQADPSPSVGIVISSGGPVTWNAAQLVGGGVPTWRKLNPLCFNSSMTKVIVHDDGPQLLGFNDIAHLELADTEDPGQRLRLMTHR